MDDREAISTYNREDSPAHCPHALWPHVDLRPDNLARLFEGVLGEKLNMAAIALGEGADRPEVAERVEEAWRLDTIRARFAPEGVFVHGSCTVRVALWPDPLAGDEAAGELEAEAEIELVIHGELCLSFTERFHTRPFVDFMRGLIRITRTDGIDPGDDLERVIDPFALMVTPQLAVAWGLNG